MPSTPAATSPSRSIAAEAVVAHLPDHAHDGPGLGGGRRLVGALAAGGERVARAEHGLARPRQGVRPGTAGRRSASRTPASCAPPPVAPHLERNSPSRRQLLPLAPRRRLAKGSRRPLSEGRRFRPPWRRRMTRRLEEIIVDARTVACDGGGVLGHPLVFLAIDRAGEVDCPYCEPPLHPSRLGQGGHAARRHATIRRGGYAGPGLMDLSPRGRDSALGELEAAAGLAPCRTSCARPGANRGSGSRPLLSGARRFGS